MAVVLGKIHWLAKLQQHVVASLGVRACPQYRPKLPCPPPKSSQPFDYCVSFHFKVKWLKGEVMSRFIPFIFCFRVFLSFMSSGLPTSPIPVSSQNRDTLQHSIIVATPPTFYSSSFVAATSPHSADCLTPISFHSFIVDQPSIL